MIRAVVFDVGETLVDETRSWAGWADHMGVPHFTFFAAMGIVVARGWHHRRVFDLVRPGFDHEAAAAERRAGGTDGPVRFYVLLPKPAGDAAP